MENITCAKMNVLNDQCKVVSMNSPTASGPSSVSQCFYSGLGLEGI